MTTPKTPSDDFRPDPSRGNASDPGQIADPHRGLFLPTWRPDAEFSKKDVTGCRIAASEVDGSFTAFHDSNNPATLEAHGPGGFIRGDQLHTGGFTPPSK